MTKLTVKRVTELPVTLQGNTVYFTEDQENGLVISVTNEVGDIVKSTYSKEEILQWIADNVPAASNYDEVIQQIFEEISLLRSSIAVIPAPFEHEW